LKQGPALRVHGRLPELLGIHLTETLIALNIPLLRLAGPVDDLIPLSIGVGVVDLPAVLQPVERRLSDVQPPINDQALQMPEEEGQEERPDMGTVHIGIGHQDDPMIAELGRVELIADGGS
jgi:hypothetical protein